MVRDKWYVIRVNYMRIIKQKDVNISELAGELKHGKVIVYPTETCYGLGADATNQAAVERLFAIKGRAPDKAVLMLIDRPERIKQYVEWTPFLDKLARAYWPGPLTIVIAVKDKKDLADGVVAADATIAVRVSARRSARELCRALGRPLISTSANLAGGDNPYEIEMVFRLYDQAKARPDIVIDAGNLPRRPPSTIVKVVGEKIEALRQGEIIIKTCNM